MFLCGALNKEPPKFLIKGCADQGSAYDDFKSALHLNVPFSLFNEMRPKVMVTDTIFICSTAHSFRCKRRGNVSEGLHTESKKA